MARLVIRLSGPFEVQFDGERIASFESNSTRALLAYLAAEPGRPRVRAAVAEMLWPERPQGAALGNLRHTLSSLRRSLGGDEARSFLVADRTTVMLIDSDDVWVDVAALEDLAATPPEHDGAIEAWEQAASMWRGPLLEDVRVRAGAEWDEWLLVTNERARRTVCDALRNVVEFHERTGNTDRALTHAQRLVDVDPWDERAHRSVMRLLASTGDEAGALASFDHVQERLRAELDAAPAPETVALAERIRAGDRERTASQPDVSYPEFLNSDRQAHAVAPFVNQAEEISFLEKHLAAATSGEGRIVMVSGEAGSGKTMLAVEMMRRAVASSDALAVIGRSNAYAGLGDPYLPFRDVLASLTGKVESDLGSGVLDLEGARRLWEAVPLSARLVLERGPSLIGVMVNGALLADRVERAAPDVPWLDTLRSRVAAVAARPPMAERLQPALFDEYASVLDGLARLHPLLIVVDDLQWADVGSVAFLWHLARRLDGHRILVIGCYRPEELAPNPLGAHSLQVVIDEVRAMAPDRVLELSSRREFVDAFLDSEPNLLDEAFRQRLQTHTEGHPLFTVEMVRGMQDRAEIRKGEEGLWIVGGALDWDRLPTRVEAAIARRLRRLPDETYRDLAVAAVQGEEFTGEVVARVRDDPAARSRIRAECSSESRVIEPSGSARIADELIERYRFRHILFQQYLYRRHDEAERIRLHEATGRSLEALYSGQAEPPVLDLAHHFDEAGLIEPTIEYTRAAGRRAFAMSANEEAIGHFQRALRLLDTLPESPERDVSELELLMLLMASLMGVRGYTAPGSEAAGERVAELSDHLGPSPIKALALAAFGHYLTIRAHHERALAVAERVREIAETLGDTGLRSLGTYMCGYGEMWMGHLDTGGDHLEAAIELYDPEQHAWIAQALGQAVGPEERAWGAVSAVLRGRISDAYRMADEGIALARQLGYPFSLCHALTAGGLIARMVAGHHDSAIPFADEAVEIARREHFPFWAAAVRLYRGVAVGHARDPDHGIELIERGMAEWWGMGVRTAQGFILADLAALEGLRGRPERGLEVVRGEMERAITLGEGLSEMCLRLEKGRLECAIGDAESGERTLRNVAAMAHKAGAHLLELRAATALASLFADAGAPADGKAVLASALACVDEESDWGHIAAARTVLAAT